MRFGTRHGSIANRWQHHESESERNVQSGNKMIRQYTLNWPWRGVVLICRLRITMHILRIRFALGWGAILHTICISSIHRYLVRNVFFRIYMQFTERVTGYGLNLHSRKCCWMIWSSIRQKTTQFPSLLITWMVFDSEFQLEPVFKGLTEWCHISVKLHHVVDYFL